MKLVPNFPRAVKCKAPKSKIWRSIKPSHNDGGHRIGDLVRMRGGSDDEKISIYFLTLI